MTATTRAATLRAVLFAFALLAVLPRAAGAGDAPPWSAEDPVLRVAAGSWLGWAPLVVANGGLAPSSGSYFHRKHGFRVEVAREKGPDLGAHLFCGTLDELLQGAPALARDAASTLRIVQLVSWSRGSEVLVAREGSGIATVDDLHSASGGRKRTVVVGAASSLHFLLLHLHYAGIALADVDVRLAPDLLRAAALFTDDPTVDACVTWTRGSDATTLVSSTTLATHAIAGVCAARADFADAHTEVVEALVQGIFAGMSMITADPERAARILGDALEVDAVVAARLLAGVHLARREENRRFFLDPENPVGVAESLKATHAVLARAKLLGEGFALPPLDQVVDARSVRALCAPLSGPPPPAGPPPARSSAQPPDLAAMRTVLVMTRRIHFNPSEVHPNPEYDPGVPAVLEEIGHLAARFGACTIQVENHRDRSKYEEAKKLGEEYFRKHAEATRRLTLRRAEETVRAVCRRFPGLDATRFAAAGAGWDRPLETDALSRRLEIRVLAPRP